MTEGAVADVAGHRSVVPLLVTLGLGVFAGALDLAVLSLALPARGALAMVVAGAGFGALLGAPTRYMSPATSDRSSARARSGCCRSFSSWARSALASRRAERAAARPPN